MGFGKNFKFGDQPTASNVIQKLKLVENEVRFLTILNIDDVFVANTHFVQPVGSFYCWRTQDEDGIITYGSCCKAMEDLGKSKNCSEKLVVPVAVYTPTGKNTFQAPIQFFRMELTSSDYEQLLRALEDEEVSPEEIPTKAFKVTGIEKGVGQYARVTPEFRVKGDSLIPRDPALKLQTQEFLAKYNEAVKESVAKTITEEKLIKVVEDAKLNNGEVTTAKPETPAEKESTSKQAPPVSNQPQAQTLPELDDAFLDDGYDLSSVLDEDFLND